MPFSLRIGSALVTADTAAEAAELVRELGSVTPAGEAPKRAQGTGSVEETPSGWRFRLRTGAGARIGRGGFKSREEAETALEKVADGGPAPAPKRRPAKAPPDPRPPGTRGPKPGNGEGGVYPTASGKWRCRVMFNMKQAQGPSRLTRKEAEADLFLATGCGIRSEEEWRRDLPGFAAAVAEDDSDEVAPPPVPLPPPLVTPRRQLLQDPVAPAPTAGAPARAVETPNAESGEAAPGEPRPSRWLTKHALKHQLPPGPTKERQYSLRAAEGIKAYWDRKRAAATQSAKSDSNTEIVLSVQAKTQQPPACNRCFRVGHVVDDCPSAAPAPTRDLPTCAESQTDPSCLTAEPQDIDGLARLLLAEGQPVESLDHLLDDDEGTDLTDLVDVPDAEATVIPDINLGLECHGCGQRGHTMRSPQCPLSQGTESTESRAAPRSQVVRSDGPRIRGKTIAAHRLSRVEKSEISAQPYPDDVERPLTRGDCMDWQRPCPFVSCSHHLYLDVNPDSGAIKINFPHLEVWEMAETCSLDVADRGGITLEELGAILNLTRERIRQVEVRGLTMMKENSGNELGLPPE